MPVQDVYKRQQLYSRVFYDNMKDLGDVPSTFEAFYDQLQAGLNMGLAGIPWWTTDIGGFMTDDVNDPDFQQLLIRWYEFAVYSAVLRMHGDRGPYNIPMLDDRDFGGGCLHTGQPNELWSYGEENYKIMKKYYDIRIEMHDYIKKTVRRGIRERTRDGNCLLYTSVADHARKLKSTGRSRILVVWNLHRAAFCRIAEYFIHKIAADPVNPGASDDDKAVQKLCQDFFSGLF